MAPYYYVSQNKLHFFFRFTAALTWDGQQGADENGQTETPHRNSIEQGGEVFSWQLTAHVVHDSM